MFFELNETICALNKLVIVTLPLAMIYTLIMGNIKQIIFFYILYFLIGIGIHAIEFGGACS